MDATIHKHIHQVFEAVMELEPLSPSATPGTKKDFANTTDAFQHYSDLIHCHLSGIREASGLDDKIQWDEPEAPEEPEAPKTHMKPKIVCCLFVLHECVDFIFLDRCESVQAGDGAAG